MDDDYKGGKRLSKRRKLVKEIINSKKISTKALEEFVRSATRSDKTSALFAKTPCDIKEDEFAQRYGMIKVTELMPAYDRFRSIETPEETLRLISKLVGEDVAYSTRFQAQVSGEQHEIGIQDRLLRNLGRFTKPRPREEQEPTYQAPATDKQATDAGDGDAADEARNAADQTQDAEKKAGFAIQLAMPAHVHVEDEELEQGMPNSDDQEVMPQSSSAASPRQHADWKLYVYKTGPAMLGQELKVVDDVKTSASSGNLVQPAMYAIDELRNTLKQPKESRRPIYLLAHDAQFWFYGIMEIDDFVTVKKEQIDPSRLKRRFPEALKAVNPRKFTPSATQSQVLAEFEAWKDEMADAGMQIPDGVHPVGRLFLRRARKHEMPNLSGYPMLMDGQKRYFDGMLKILVGRRATKWSPEDAQNAWDARKDLITRKC